MASRGQIAKDTVIQAIQSAFGDDYLGTDGKKYYVLAQDGGSRKIQVAITLSCPKEVYKPEAQIAFGEEKEKVTQKEKDDIQNLMERLGL